MAVITEKKKSQRMTEWIAGGRYAVAVEIEATFFPDRPGDPFLTPDTVRFLEQIGKDAREGNVQALQKAGQVYVLVEESGNGPNPGAIS